MAQKWNLQDIRPPERKARSVQRPVNDGPQKPAPAGDTDMRPPKRPPREEPVVEDEYEEFDPIEIKDGRKGRMRGSLLIVGVIVIVGLIAFGITSLLRGADVTVYPKFKDVNVQATFTAERNPEVGELGYELLVLEEEGERVVGATGQEEVSERATGRITVYNEFSTNPQRLIKNTRFESPEGLIYRIPESVMVPGFTRDAEDNIVPGTIQVEVFSDGTGEQYNIPPARFTIPGLEGSDQFDAMYAISEMEFMGGFEGMQFIIDEEELATTKQELHLELRDKLLARLPSERPAGLVLFDGAVTFLFDSLPSVQRGEDNALIKERGRLVVPLFNAENFSNYIAANTIVGYEGEDVRLENPEQIAFRYPQATSTDITMSDIIGFNLAGNTRVIWIFDQEQLQNDLVGVAKTALPAVLGKYPAIERAEAVVRPFWRQAFPDSTDQIEVIEIIELGEEGESEG